MNSGSSDKQHTAAGTSRVQAPLDRCAAPGPAAARRFRDDRARAPARTADSGRAPPRSLGGAGGSRDTFSCKRATPYHIYKTVKSILRTRTDGDAAPRYPARDREPRADTPLRVFQSDV